MKAEPASYLALLEPLLPAWFPEHAQQGLALRAEDQPRVFTYSVVQRLAVLAGGEPVAALALKQPLATVQQASGLPTNVQQASGLRPLSEPDATVQQASGLRPLAELAAMQRLRAHFAGQTGLQTPRGLYASADPPLLVSEWAAGARLHLLLRGCRRGASPTRRQEALAAAAQAGRWLAHLHRLAPEPGCQHPRPPAQQIEQAHHMLQAAGVAANRLMTIRSMLAQCDFAADTAALLHHDFGLRNLLWQGSSILALDTLLDRAGPPAIDLAEFLAGLLFIDRWQVATGARLYSAAALAGARQAFLAAYGASQPLPPASLLTAYTALRVFTRWAEYAAHLRRTQPRAAALLLPKLIHPYFAAACERVLKNEA